MVNKILEFVSFSSPLPRVFPFPFPLRFHNSHLPFSLVGSHLQQGRTEGNWEVGCYQRSRSRDARYSHRRGRLRSMSFGDQG